jgi:hypothetical protein
MSSVERFFANSSVGAALARPEEPASEAEGSPAEGASRQEADEQAAPPVPNTQTGAPNAGPAEPRPRGDLAVLPMQPARNVVPVARRTGEAVDKQREFQLTRSTDETLEDLVTLYRRSTGAELTRSHVLRAVLKAVAERMPRLRQEAGGIGPLRRPSNAKGFEEAREEFEEQIKQAFLRGMTEVDQH